MKKLLISFIVFSFTKVLFSQEITASLAYPNPNFQDVTYTRTDGGIALLVMGAKDSPQKIQKYDGSFKKEWEIESPVNVKKGTNIVQFTSFLDKLYLFYSEQTPKPATYYYCYDLKGKLISEKPTLLTERNLVSGMTNTSTGLHFRYSANREKLLILNDKAVKHSDLYVIDYFVFDGKGLSSKGTISLPYKRSELYIDEVEISNAGNIFFQGHSTTKSLIGKGNHYRVWVYKWNCVAKKGVKQEIDLAGRRLTSVQMLINDDESIQLAGGYIKFEKKDELGIVYYAFPADLSAVSKESYVSLEESNATPLIQWLKANKAIRFDRFDMIDIHALSNGNIGIVLESGFTSSDQNMENRVGMYSKLLAAYFVITKEGKIQYTSMWKKFHSKVYSSSGFKGILVAKSGDKRYVFSHLKPENFISAYRGSEDCCPKASQDNVYLSKINQADQFEPMKPIFKNYEEELNLKIGSESRMGMGGYSRGAVTSDIEKFIDIPKGVDCLSEQISDNTVILLQLKEKKSDYVQAVFTKVVLK